jgi:hypothetical protein
VLAGALAAFDVDVDRPIAPSRFRYAISASRQEVLPVWRGACSRKYFFCSMSASTAARSQRCSGGRQ